MSNFSSFSVKFESDKLLHFNVDQLHIISRKVLTLQLKED